MNTPAHPRRSRMTIQNGYYSMEGAATRCQRYASGTCLCDHPLTDSPRCYFERVAIRGCRAIFQWDGNKRWPDDKPIFGGNDRLWIEGVEFADIAATSTFDIDQVAYTDAWQMFQTWDEAEAWLTSQPPAPEGAPDGR